MTSSEFIIWMKGFVEACHEYAPTPKQWDILKDQLAKVTKEEYAQKIIPHDPYTPTNWPIINPAHWVTTCSNSSDVELDMNKIGTISSKPIKEILND